MTRRHGSSNAPFPCLSCVRHRRDRLSRVISSVAPTAWKFRVQSRSAYKGDCGGERYVCCYTAANSPPTQVRRAAIDPRQLDFFDSGSIELAIALDRESSAADQPNGKIHKAPEPRRLSENYCRPCSSRADPQAQPALEASAGKPWRHDHRARRNALLR